jgi:hypothetical protein
MTCDALDDGEMTRNTLAALPVDTHIAAIAAYHGVNLTGCHDSFERADRILRYLHPELHAGEEAFLDKGAMGGVCELDPPPPHPRVYS